MQPVFSVFLQQTLLLILVRVFMDFLQPFFLQALNLVVDSFTKTSEGLKGFYATGLSTESESCSILPFSY